MNLPLSKARLGIAAAALGGASALAFVTVAGAGGSGSASAVRLAAAADGSADDGPADVSGPCDEAEHANDPRCTAAAPAGAAVPNGAAPDGSAAAAGQHSLRTVGGTVTYTVDGATLTLVDAAPASGWTVEVEQASGPEIEVDFRSGTRRVQANVELEDGQVRERVRVRDEATGAEVRIENGVVVRDEPADEAAARDRDDHEDREHRDDRDDRDDDRGDDSGPGSASSGPSHRDDDGPADDSSGPG